ncbi:MAG TPA: magnesium/cobalt transporter CorA [Candidatus Methanoperedens sp.]|nr:magnesium/cobalt transporter CorA [Candidatus Methanoperedens sp.]
MSRSQRKRIAHKVGLPPGTPVAATEPPHPVVGVTQVLYDAVGYAEREIATIEEAFPEAGEQRTLWINVDGVHDIALLEHVGRRFGLHPLLLEDVAHTEQRPKLESYGEHLFLDLNVFHLHAAGGEVHTEQISLVLGANWLLSFTEGPQPWAQSLRERLRADKGRARQGGADYLAYSILDAVVDGYYVVLERIGDRVEELEEELMAAPTPKTLHAVYALKREVINLRKSVWPLRELIGGLQRERDLVREGTQVYLRDLYDHAVQVLDTVETYRDILAGMLDIYLSSVSNRMNEVMKVLTVIATIFIPLTFIAGVYGMNFEHMPELRWRYGYALIWGVMLAVGAAMLLYFRRKRWF